MTVLTADDGRTSVRLGPAELDEAAASPAAGPPAITEANRPGRIPEVGPSVTVHVARAAELRHGYTLASLNDLSVQAVRVQRFHRTVDFTARVQIAWSAMAEVLYAADEAPTPHDLIRAAWAAIGDEIDRMYRTYGFSTSDRYAGRTRRFQQYWIGAGNNTRSPEDPIVERVALAQIWPQLRPTHRQLLLALAVHDDYEKAADALNKPRKSFSSQLAEARRAFLTLWHDGEQPSRQWGADRRKSADSTDRHPTTSIVRRREKRGRANAAAHREQPSPPRRRGKPPAELGITTQELARRYQEVKSIRVLAGLLGVSYGALQRRLQAEGITRSAPLTEEVRQRKRRRARDRATAPTDGIDSKASRRDG
jgi:hypothetical protein